MKLAFVLVCWLLAFFACTVLKWGVQPHIRAASEFCRGFKDVLALSVPDHRDAFAPFDWYDAGVLVTGTLLGAVITWALVASLAWAIS